MREEKDRRIEYIEKVFVRESGVLKRVRGQAGKLEKLGMQISPYEGQLLSFLCQSIQAKKVVEIGTFVGYSAIWLAKAIGPEGQLLCFEQNEAYAKLAEEHFSSADLKNIEVFLGEANERLAEIENRGPFDVVFIDANKSAYPSYLEWAESHLRVGGMVIADNTFLFGHVYAEEKPQNISQAQWQGMRQFNKSLADEKKWTSILIPTAEGLSVALKK